ncbi:Met31p PWA37_000923 [Arxiozyma heterogenica]|uniref:C2H2-type domain-containing protein n=1 Tax=Arxiozyma heterogenica TaxID=278026 RepID=A0AAN8A8M1_9SACH|nr:hypothetical protein RI543_002836 [Kazachstania heterogenica]
MSEELLFIRQAIDALVSTSEEISSVNPTIRELLERMKPTSSNQNIISYSLNGNTNNNNKSKSSSNNDANNISNISPLSPAPTAMSSSFSVANSAMQEKFKYVIPNQTMMDAMNFKPISIPSVLNDNIPQINNTPIDSQILSENLARSTQKLGRRRKTEKPPEEKFYCNKCELVFTKMSELKRHEKGHLLILPHICSRCGKGFARKDALKRHGNTLTCDRNRKKLKEALGDKYEEYIARAHRDGISI